MDENGHLFVPFIEFLQWEVQLGGEHVCFFDSMHSAFGSGLGTLFVLGLVGDHLFN